MKFSKKQLWATLLLGACLCVLPVSDVAAQGSWGGSFGGSVGSGGSWGGSGGLLGGRRPVADLLSRIGDRLSGGSTGFGGSSGGSSGFGGSSGGSSGFGGSTGSSSFASESWGGSTGSFASTSNFYVNDFVSAPVVETASYSPAASYSSFSLEQSFPVGDQGLDPNYPIFESYTGSNVIGGISLDGAFGGAFTPTSTPLVDDTFNGQPTPATGSSRIEDGGSIDGMLEGAEIPADPYYDSLPGNSDLPNPGPTNDSTDLTAPLKDANFAGVDRAVLRLKVPRKAKVYVNGRLTKTPGAVRSFESKNLVAGRVYKYKVKAVIEQDGKQLVRSKLISLQAGRVQETMLDFDAPVTTVLTLNVPKDASVKLCGKGTELVGTKRRFVTTQLIDGEVCEDYRIEVSYRVDGEMVKQVRKINLAAGDIRTLTFDNEVTERVAKR